jgi:hypothetical protein
VCGEAVSWDEADLVAAIRPGYGYSDDSPQICWLRETLLGMAQLQRCSFVQYVTSTPRLPLGGVRKLAHGGVRVDKLSETPGGDTISDPAVRLAVSAPSRPGSSAAARSLACCGVSCISDISARVSECPATHSAVRALLLPPP